MKQKKQVVTIDRAGILALSTVSRAQTLKIITDKKNNFPKVITIIKNKKLYSKALVISWFKKNDIENFSYSQNSEKKNYTIQQLDNQLAVKFLSSKMII
jgi:hypothetical protein